MLQAEEVARCTRITQFQNFSRCQRFCLDSARSVNWDGAGRAENVHKALHCIFEKMGGYQVAYYLASFSHCILKLQESALDQHLSEEETDTGFDFIGRDGPCPRHSNQQFRWVVMQLSTEDSPICKWLERLVSDTFGLMNVSVLLFVTDFRLACIDVSLMIVGSLQLKHCTQHFKP